MTGGASGIVRQVVTFGRCLREAGLEVGPARLQDALTGLSQVEVGRRDDVYWTLRTTLVTRPEELETFDRAFRAWFMRIPTLPDARRKQPPVRRVREKNERREGAGEGEPDAAEETSEVGWSAHELLRRKDFAAMTPDELARLRVLLRAVALRRPVRRSRRLRPHHRGDVVDLRRLARRSLGTGGDPVERAFRRRTQVPRKLVVLCDVSGSMERYTRALLLFLHAVVGSGRGVEVFAFGTRLTRLTAELRLRDPDVALERASAAIADWSGGTRIGASLGDLHRTHGRRLGRGAAVVILSDGWDRGEPEVLAAEMARLRRSAHRVIWLNPLKAAPGYAPLARGMAAALPHADHFLAGHSLRSLAELADLLEDGLEGERGPR